MKNIQPTHVTDKQAKLLKEKGFKGIVFYTDGTTHTAPEQWQVCEWLRVEKGIHIEILLTESSPYNTFYYRVMKVGQYFTLSHDDVYFTTPQEAYSAAFDCILNELI